MKQTIGLITLVVDEYEPAIDFYVNKLGFKLIEDTPIPEEAKRWVVVAPNGSSGTQLLLARAADEQQSSRIGNQTGGRISMFLYTDDFYTKAKESFSFVHQKKNAMAKWPFSKISMEICGI